MSYTWKGMIKIGRVEAIGRFNSDRGVYLLYDDNTEALVEKLEDIKEHEGEFGRHNHDREKVEIEAEEGEEFCDYVDKDGSRVHYGTVIGLEYEDADENDEIMLKDGIYFANGFSHKDDDIIEPTVKCEACKYIGGWTHKSTGKEIWLTCRCGSEQEMKA